MPEIQPTAKSLEKLSKEHLETHETFEGLETMFHIPTSVVARRKEFWLLSMVGGVLGLFFFVKAFVHAPSAFEKKRTAAQSAPASPGGHKVGGEKTAEHPEKKSSEEPTEKANEPTR